MQSATPSGGGHDFCFLHKRVAVVGAGHDLVRGVTPVYTRHELIVLHHHKAFSRTLVSSELRPRAAVGADWRYLGECVKLLPAAILR